MADRVEKDEAAIERAEVSVPIMKVEQG